ncbi:MAG: hypothetical protein ACXAB7_03970 [Candidatus Kariarchaeaceae archaeon]
MQIYNFVIINRDSGVTLLTRNYGMFDDDADDSPFLFSAAMIAIQDLMNDIRVGRIKTIKTEEYQIIGEMTDRLVIFAIGVFESHTTIINFLRKVGDNLESWIDENDKLMIFDATLTNIINIMCDQFVNLWTAYTSFTGIFLDKNILGYQGITPSDDSTVESTLTGYFSRLPNTFASKAHSFYDILPTGGSVLCLFVPIAETQIIVYTYFENVDIKVIISNKQNFLNKSLEFILSHGEEIVKNEGITSETEEAWELFNTELKESMVQYSQNYEFFANETLFSRFGINLARLLDQFMIGRPVAVICPDDLGSQIIDLLIYLTGTTSASFTLDEENPQRILCGQSVDHSHLKELNYIIFDINNPGMIETDLEYFTLIWDQIYDPSRHIKNILSDLHVEILHIWDTCVGILIQHIFGQSPDVIFSSIPFSNQEKFVRRVINWINPYILMEEPKDVGFPKNNW